MANIKLTGNTWDTSGVYDIAEGCTQREVNKNTKDFFDFKEYIPIRFTLTDTGKYLVYNTGAIASSTNYSCTDYIDLTGFDRIRYKRIGITGSPATSGMVFYDENKNFIRGIANGESQSALGYMSDMYTYRIPDVAVYARFTVLANTSTHGNFEVYGRTNTFALKEGLDSNTIIRTLSATNETLNIDDSVSDEVVSAVTEYPYSSSAYTNLSLAMYSTNLYSTGLRKINTMLNTSGNETSESNYWVLGPFYPEESPDYDGSIYIWYRNTASSSKYIRVFSYDANGTATQINNSTYTAESQSRTFTLPSNCKYVKISISSATEWLKIAWRRLVYSVTPTNFYGGTVKWGQTSAVVTSLYDSTGELLETPVVTENTALRWLRTFNHYTRAYAYTDKQYRSSGSVSITYRCDPELYINSKSNDADTKLKQLSLSTATDLQNPSLDWTVDQKNMYVKYDDGTTAASTTLSATNYVDVHDCTKIIYKRCGGTSSTQPSGMAYYTKDKVYITGSQTLASQATLGYIDFLTSNVPFNAYYARFTVFSNTDTYGEFEAYGVPKIKNGLDNLFSAFAPMRQITPSWIQGGISGGSLVTSTIRVRTGRYIINDSASCLIVYCPDGYKMAAVMYNRDSGLTHNSSTNFFQGWRCFLGASKYAFKFTMGKASNAEITPSEVPPDYLISYVNLPYWLPEASGDSIATFTTQRCNPTYVNEMVAVAETYYDHRNDQTNGQPDMTYGYDSAIRVSGYTREIDCSSFVGLVLRGYEYEDTQYYTKENTDPSDYDANSEYVWSVNPSMYTTKLNVLDDEEGEVTRASALAEWMISQGRRVKLDKRLVNIEVGDICFYSYNQSGTYTPKEPDRFKCISHIAICVAKRPTEETDPWSAEDYPYAHQILEVTSLTPCVHKEWLEEADVPYLVCVCRPDLGTL